MNLTYSFDWCFLFLPLGVTVSSMFVEFFEEPALQGMQPCDDDPHRALPSLRPQNTHRDLYFAPTSRLLLKLKKVQLLYE